MERGFYSSLARFVQRRRAAVLIGYAVLTALLAWSASRITLKADITDLLPEGAASGDDLRFFLDRFGNTNALFFSLGVPDGEDPEALERTADRLSARLLETGLFRSIRHGFGEEEAIEAARRAMVHLPVLLPAESAADLSDRLTPEAIGEALRALKRRAESPFPLGPLEALAAQDPLGLLSLLPAAGPAGAAPGSSGPLPIDPGSGLLLSGDGRSLLVVATPIRPPQDVAFSKRLLGTVESIEAQVAGDEPGVTIDHAGGYLFAVQDEARIRHDITATSTISLAAIAVLFALVLRRLGLLALLMVPLGLSTLWTLGVAAIHPGHLNVVTVAFAAIILGVGDDALTHLYLRFREACASGRPRDEAVCAAMAATGPSIIVATLTSGLAFSALTFVEFRGLSELGIIAAIGLLNLLVSVLFLFPALLSLPGGARTPRAPVVLPMGPFAAFHRLARPRRGVVLGVTALVAIAAGLSASRLEFSSDLRDLRGSDPARDRLERLLAPFGGLPEPIHLVAEAADAGDALARAEAIDPLCRRLREEGVASACTSPADWIPSPARQRRRFEAHAGNDWTAVGDDLARTADRLGMNAAYFEPFLRNLPRYARWDAVRIDPAAAVASDAEPLPGFAVAGGAVAVDVVVHPADGISPETLARRALAIDPDLRAGGVRVASVGLVVSDLTAIIETDFRKAALIALAAVGLIAFVAFRSASRILLVMLPVAIGSLLMLGTLPLLGVPINLMNLVAAPLVFGLGVDFGVYIVNRHEEEGRRDVTTVLRHTGGAILLTGLTTMAGFGSLLSADFAGLKSMGWVAVLGIGGCLLSALLILPLVLPGPGGRPAAPRPPGPDRSSPDAGAAGAADGTRSAG